MRGGGGGSGAFNKQTTGIYKIVGVNDHDGGSSAQNRCTPSQKSTNQKKRETNFDFDAAEGVYTNATDNINKDPSAPISNKTIFISVEPI